LDRGVIQVLTPSRTLEEIREKDKRLREFQAFTAQNRDFSFLEYLKQARHEDPMETGDEILAQLRGRRFESNRGPKSAGVAAGEILLCLIHDWLSREWEIDQALDRLAGQEKALAGIMEEGFEFSGDWNVSATIFTTSGDAELVCPSALQAWIELQKRLSPNAPVMLTNQRWIRQDRYRTNPEEAATVSVPLPQWTVAAPSSRLKDIDAWAAIGLLQPIRKIFRGREAGEALGKKQADDLLAALKALALPDPGRYLLTFPPFPDPDHETRGSLFLLSRKF
jgi:hypothetical protein